MFGYCQWFLFISLFVIIHSQRNDDRDYPPERYQTSRVSKTSFDTQFSTGRCPQRFFQVADECLFFATDGKSYSWIDAERVCRKRIGRMVDEWAESSANANQPNIKPTLGVRQLVLNTPEKTDILRALYQIYSEENFAVRLPDDYNSLRRCSDGQDDKWPYFCNSNVAFNTTCFETKASSSNDLCLRDVTCGNRYLRLACEFTLPGSPEITESKFRHCPKSGRQRRRLPIWAWVLIAVGSALVLLIILATIITYACKSKRKTSKYSPGKAYPDHRLDQDRTRRQNPPSRQDPASEPMIIRPAPPPRPTEDTGYLQPRSDDRPTTNSSNSNA